MAFALPAEYQHGFVTGRIIRAKADTAADPDALPEAIAAAGKVRFTPRQQRRSTGEALVLHEPIEITLDADGYVHDGQRRGVWLMDGVWDVKFTLTTGTIPDFPVTVSIEHTDLAPLDLATAMPYSPPLVPLKVVTEEMASAVLAAYESGVTGPPGDDGAPGASAYDLAVSSGFVGTESAWLASLKGPKGDTGERGLQGIQGVKGDKGDAGTQGVQGLKGDKGDTGSAGTNGVTPVLVVKWTGSGYPTQAASAPAGTSVRWFVGPEQYSGPTWAGVTDVWVYAAAA